VIFITYFSLGLKLRMNGGIPLLSHIPSWCGQGLYQPFTLRLVSGKSTNIRNGTPPAKCKVEVLTIVANSEKVNVLHVSFPCAFSNIRP
jgi:hypothetical protein